MNNSNNKKYSVKLHEGNMLITPLWAKAILEERNIKNRKSSDAYVAGYAEDMKKGRWKNNGVPLIFVKETGVLADGQHRLMAIIESGTSQTMKVTFVEENDIGGYDIGKNRSVQECIFFESDDEMMKIGNSAIAMLKLLYRYCNEDVAHNTILRGNRRVSYMAVKEAYKKFPDIYAAPIKWSVSKRDGAVVNINSVGIRLALYFAWKCGVDIKSFSEVLYTGVQKSNRDELIIRFRNAIQYPPCSKGGETALKLYYATQWLIYTYFNTAKYRISSAMWNNDIEYYFPLEIKEARKGMENE